MGTGMSDALGRRSSLGAGHKVKGEGERRGTDGAPLVTGLAREHELKLQRSEKEGR